MRRLPTEGWDFKRLLESQLNHRVTACHKDGEGCALCAYGHVMAQVAEEFLRREDYAADDCIIRWGVEVDRRWRSLRAAGMN
jgi:hypothetical protein